MVGALVLLGVIGALVLARLRKLKNTPYDPNKIGYLNKLVTPSKCFYRILSVDDFAILQKKTRQ